MAAEEGHATFRSHITKHSWDSNNKKDFSYGTIQMKESNSHLSSGVGDLERAPPGGIEAAITRSKPEAEIEQSMRSENSAIKTWRNISGLAICILVCLTLVAIIVESVRMAKDNNNSNGQIPVSELTESLRLALKDASSKQQNNLQESFASFSESITQQFKPTAWPLVTDPLFEVQGKHIRSTTHVEFFAFSPLVTEERRSDWEAYASENQDWIQQNWQFLSSEKEHDVDAGHIAPHIYDQNHFSKPATGPGPYAPLWQTSPPPRDAIFINRDVLSIPELQALYADMLTHDDSSPVISQIMTNLQAIYGFGVDEEPEDQMQAQKEEPCSVMFVPVMDTLTHSQKGNLTGFLQVVLNWQTYIVNVVPRGFVGSAALQSNCGQNLYYRKDAGLSDPLVRVPQLTVTASDAQVVSENLLPLLGGHGDASCTYTLQLMPEIASREDNSDNISALSAVVLAFSVASILGVFFYHYDKIVDRRNEKLLKSATASSVSNTNSTEPLLNGASPQIDDKTMNTHGEQESEPVKEGSQSQSEDNTSESSAWIKDIEVHPDDLENVFRKFIEDGNQGDLENSSSQVFRKFMEDGMPTEYLKDAAPIADLFPNCTVLYADIAGFTAWSSVREPSMVFQLLETLYHAFDDIAKRKNVFKVDTVGDCYVAVTGLPDPQKEHSLNMIRFARECMYRSYELTKKLEVSLGPDTGDLSMRFGLHSGPVIAGILRGNRSRFQLFGDTVGIASRIENTGQKGRIHLSEETANCLRSLGKSHLLRMRNDKITMKGEGEMTTYWLVLGADNDDDSTDGETSDDNVHIPMDEEDSSSEQELDLDDRIGSGQGRPKPPEISMSEIEERGHERTRQSKSSRLVDWNVEILSKLVKQIIARRNALGLKPAAEEEMNLVRPEGQTVLEEVREIITLPKFEAAAAKKQEDPEKIELGEDIKNQLHEYVTTLASMYRDNHFHNYEHATHVTMSVTKLLSRIVAPKSVTNWDREAMTSEEKMASSLHDHTYGITSDPLTQFSIVLSALIHDVDHTGVPNAQLVKENARVAARYKNKSVAEQNSLDLSWDLLMEPRFKNLRKAIYCDQSELSRFRSLLVNVVMATDIVDKELKQLRNDRWDKAFSGEDPENEEEVTAAVNRKATIVLEHIIQASDVSHTMQHWHVYRRWNERLFMELYSAFRQGRAEKDPAEFWYSGEIGFFDFYIIPLAKKLKDCGVFGVSSDEYLNYALKNREEWAQKGEAVTAQMVAKARDMESARMEKQASMRGPIIAEMKAAVASMRQPQKANTSVFKQKSFRHLQVEPEVAESIGVSPQRSFSRRPPPSRGSLGAVRHTNSIGSSEREALMRFRRKQPQGVDQNRATSGLRMPDKPATRPNNAAITEETGPSNRPINVKRRKPVEVRGGLRIPERKTSNTTLEETEEHSAAEDN